MSECVHPVPSGAKGVEHVETPTQGKGRLTQDMVPVAGAQVTPSSVEGDRCA